MDRSDIDYAVKLERYNSKLENLEQQFKDLVTECDKVKDTVQALCIDKEQKTYIYERVLDNVKQLQALCNTLNAKLPGMEAIKERAADIDELYTTVSELKLTLPNITHDMKSQESDMVQHKGEYKELLALMKVYDTKFSDILEKIQHLKTNHTTTDQRVVTKLTNVEHRLSSVEHQSEEAATTRSELHGFMRAVKIVGAILGAIVTAIVSLASVLEKFNWK